MRTSTDIDEITEATTEIRIGARGVVWSVGPMTALVAVALASTTTGPAGIEYPVTAKILIDAFPQVSVSVPATAASIVMKLRMVRIIPVTVMGVVLGGAGTAGFELRLTRMYRLMAINGEER